MLATALIAFGSTGSRAEYPEPSGLTIRCDRNGNRFEVVVTGHAGPVEPAMLLTIEGGGQRDCTLANGTMIRIKADQELASPVGPCGGNPPYFFSLWVNRRKVISREPFEACGQLVLRGLLVEGRIVRHCWFDGRSRQGIDFGGDEPRSSCSELPVSRGNVGRDYVEYPANESAPRGRGIRLVAGSDAVLCGALLDAADDRQPLVGRPRNRDRPNWQDAPGWQRGPNSWAEPPQVARFDFNNDGRLDDVWRIEVRGVGFVGDYYAIVPPGATLTEEWLDERYTELLAASRRLSRPAESSARSHNVEVFSGIESLFADRQVLWTDFRHAGRTYLIGTHWWDRIRHIVAEPHAGRLRTVCIFDRPRENF